MAANASDKAFFSSKKFILLACIVIILLLLTLLFSFSQSAKENAIHPVSEPAQQHTLLSPTATATETIALTDDTSGKWNTFTKPTYSIQYPPDWLAQEFSLAANQGTIVTFKPAVLPKGVEYPKFLLQMQNEGDQAMLNSEGVLTGLGLKQSNDKLGDQDVIKFSGTIPFATKYGQTVQEPIQDTTLFLRQGAKLYVLKYEYEGSQQDSSLENFFQGFTLSFKLK